MADAGQQVPRCAYPGCKNELRPGQTGPTPEPGYCGLPDPVTGEPHTALTAFRQRRVLAGQGGQAAGPREAGRTGLAFWRRGSAQRRQQAEAAEARSAALQADALLAEALAAKAAAEQRAAAVQARGRCGRARRGGAGGRRAAGA
jgi:colicin import membrane protein